MPQLGPLEIAVVLLVALLVFGPNRLPELARQVGGALRELRRIQQNIRQDLDEVMRDTSGGADSPPTLGPRGEGEEAGESAGDGGGPGFPPGDVPTSGSAEATGDPWPSSEPD